MLSGTPFKTCSAVGDPHYTTFDGLWECNFFPGRWCTRTPWNGAPDNWITRQQPPNQWWIMSATANCHNSTYPPFAVLMYTVGSQGSPNPPPYTVPGQIRVIFYLESLHLRTKKTLPLVITLQQNQFTVCSGLPGQQQGMNCRTTEVLFHLIINKFKVIL